MGHDPDLRRSRSVLHVRRLLRRLHLQARWSRGAVRLRDRRSDVRGTREAVALCAVRSCRQTPFLLCSSEQLQAAQRSRSPAAFHRCSRATTTAPAQRSIHVPSGPRGLPWGSNSLPGFLAHMPRFDTFSNLAFPFLAIAGCATMASSASLMGAVVGAKRPRKDGGGGGKRPPQHKQQRRRRQKQPPRPRKPPRRQQRSRFQQGGPMCCDSWCRGKFPASPGDRRSIGPQVPLPLPPPRLLALTHHHVIVCGGPSVTASVCGRVETDGRPAKEASTGEFTTKLGAKELAQGC